MSESSSLPSSLNIQGGTRYYRDINIVDLQGGLDGDLFALSEKLWLSMNQLATALMIHKVLGDNWAPQHPDEVIKTAVEIFSLDEISRALLRPQVSAIYQVVKTRYGEILNDRDENEVVTQTSLLLNFTQVLIPLYDGDQGVFDLQFEKLSI